MDFNASFFIDKVTNCGSFKSTQPKVTPDEMSDDQVLERMRKDKPKHSSLEIDCARVVLKQYPKAEHISISTPETDKSANAGLALLLAFVIAILLALLLAPFVVALGMNGKFLLKKKYADRTGEGYAEFRKKFTLYGIIGWAAIIVLMAVGSIAGVSILSSIGLFGLLIGDVAYVILSFKLTKKFVTETKTEEVSEKAE